MDPTNDLIVLYTQGQGHFECLPWQCPEPQAKEIRVRSILTGICRSDIDMMVGKFTALPLQMMGHEGLGQVVSIGNQVTDVSVGEYVATRGEPAYATEYCVKQNEYVVVPSKDPEFILEPVACGINCVTQNLDLIKSKQGGRLLISGSGFLAWVVYHSIKILGLEFEVNVVGNHNKQIWGNTLKQGFSGKFDVVIDLASRDLVNQDIFNNQSVYVYASQKDMTTDFRNLLWTASTVVCPSPRTDNFHSAMVLARNWIASNQLKVSQFWTKEYSISEYKKAFDDSLNRTNNFGRGYIKWH